MSISKQGFSAGLAKHIINLVVNWFGNCGVYLTKTFNKQVNQATYVYGK